MILEYSHAVAVTPDDATDLTREARGLLVGTAGDIKVDVQDGQTVTLKNVPVGVLPLRVKRVYSTGTTASNITAMF